MARIPEHESRRVHAAILEAARSEMAEHGYAGLRVNAVAKRVGKTQGAIYARFADKEALAVATMRQLRDELVVPAVVASLSKASTAIEGLEAASAALAAVSADNPDARKMVARLALEMAGREGALAEEVQGFFRAFASVLGELVERGRKSGEIREDVDVRRFTYAIVGAPLGYASMASMFPDDVRFGEMEETMRAILTRGIADSEIGSS